MSGARCYPVAILAGGLATRLRPLTETIPKALVDVDGEPFIAHQLRLLQQHGVRARRALRRATSASMIAASTSATGRGSGSTSRSPSTAPQLLGTGGALKRALPLLGDAFFVLYGDSYLPFDYRRGRRRPSRASGKLGADDRVPQRRTAGTRATWSSRDGRIVAYDKTHRTPRMHHIDYGLGAAARGALRRRPERARRTTWRRSTRRCWRAASWPATRSHERFYEIGSVRGARGDARATWPPRRLTPRDARHELRRRNTSPKPPQIIDQLDQQAPSSAVVDAAGGHCAPAAAACSSSASAAAPPTPRTPSTTSARSPASRPTRRPTTSPS